MKIHTIQLNIEDFDSGIVGMDAVEVGAYFCILMAMYKSSNHKLIDDDKRLARIARVNMRVWKRIRPMLQKKFQLNGKEWTHFRVTKEALKYRNLVQKNRSNALKNKETYEPVASQWPSQTGANINNNKQITNNNNYNNINYNNNYIKRFEDFDGNFAAYQEYLKNRKEEQ